MAWTSPDDDESIRKCLHPQGHEWQVRATLGLFVLWRCKHCTEQSATSRTA